MKLVVVWCSEDGTVAREMVVELMVCKWGLGALCEEKQQVTFSAAINKHDLHKIFLISLSQLLPDMKTLLALYPKQVLLKINRRWGYLRDAIIGPAVDKERLEWKSWVSVNGAEYTLK